MITHLSHSQINKKKWDTCIHNAINGIIYGYSWYLDIVCPEWNALVSNDYEAVFPLTAREKYGIHYLYQPFFTQQLGLFYSKQETGLIDSFINTIPSGYKYIDINLNTKNSLPKTNFILNEKVTYHLDLISEYDVLQKGFSQNLKRNIKKAQKNNIQVALNSKPEAIVDLFKAEQGPNISELKNKDYYKLCPLIYEAQHRGMGQVWAAYNVQNELIAGIFLIKSHQKLISFLIASNEEAKQTGAVSLIFDKIIKQYSGKALTLDFEGSIIASIARFYANFGAIPIKYLNIKQNNLPWYLKIFKK